MTPVVRAKPPKFTVRFRRHAGGATAVEFAAVALPFFLLLMGIIELALAYTASTMLDNALYATSRQIRTGELQSPANAAQIETSRVAFQNSVCKQMYFLENDCKGHLTVDVRTAAQFQNISVPDPVANGKFVPGAVTFDTGTAGSIVVVRAYYRWKLIAPMINQGIARLTGSGEALLTAVTAFKNEPYNS